MAIPRRVQFVDRVSIQERITESRTSAYVGSSSTRTNTRTRTQIREVWRKDGTAERVTETAEDTQQIATEATAASASEASEHASTQTRTLDTRGDPWQPSYSLGAYASADQIRTPDPGIVATYQPHPRVQLGATCTYNRESGRPTVGAWLGFVFH